MEEKGETIRDVLIEEDMKDAYINFAMSVIINRALPDARDGLKPSQRRILVAMNDLNLGPSAKYRKSAKIAGDTAGNYHPHPESIYATMVRMAQPFNMRYELIDGQGNFGSIDGDPPAAVRYTEARLSHPGAEMLADINMETVTFVKNYDQSRDEPTVLPARFPNLLVNGSTGIAVGMATTVPPHNLGEVIDGLVALIDNPHIRLDELSQHIKGPDFPTGGIIMGRTGIARGYATGRGTITIRARTHVEDTGKDRQSIVVTEIPYMVNRTTIKAKIADSVHSGSVTGISDFRDESDRKGQRLVIELKRNEDPERVLNQLYLHTPLQNNFGMNVIALVHGRPKTLGLKELLVCFRDHRIDVVRRRTQFLLRRAEERAHILEGLMIALNHIDEIIELIKSSPSVDEAREQLMRRYSLSIRQSNAILQMQLQRLTSLEQQKVYDEHRKLVEQIEEYRSILASPQRVLDIIREELLELKRKYGDERRTTISTDVAEGFDVTDLIPDEPMAVTITHKGYVKRLSLDTYRTQGRGGRGVTGTGMREDDVVKDMFVATAHQYILFFTTEGRVHWLHVYDIPEQSRQSRGRPIVNLLQLHENEQISSVIPVAEFDERDIIFATAQGMVKRCALKLFSRPMRGGIIAIGLKEGDSLIDVAISQPQQGILIATKNGRAARFAGEKLRRMGRTARGVKGIRLREGDQAVGMIVTGGEQCLLTVSERGYGKRTPMDEYPVKGRGSLGVINIKRSSRNGGVIAIMAVDDDDEIMMMTEQGMVIRMSGANLRPMGRNTQGVRLVKVGKDDRVVSVARVVESEKSGETERAEPVEDEPVEDEQDDVVEEDEDIEESDDLDDGDDDLDEDDLDDGDDEIEDDDDTSTV